MKQELTIEQLKFAREIGASVVNEYSNVFKKYDEDGAKFVRVGQLWQLIDSNGHPVRGDIEIDFTPLDEYEAAQEVPEGYYLDDESGKLKPLKPKNAEAKQMSASDFLIKAGDLLSERGKDYDKPEGERSMGKTVSAFNAITGKDLSEAEGWLLLQILKDVRQWQNPEKYNADSAEDCVSYCALKAEALFVTNEAEEASK